MTAPLHLPAAVLCIPVPRFPPWSREGCRLSGGGMRRVSPERILQPGLGASHWHSDQHRVRGAPRHVPGHARHPLPAARPCPATPVPEMREMAATPLPAAKGPGGTRTVHPTTPTLALPGSQGSPSPYGHGGGALGITLLAGCGRRGCGTRLGGTESDAAFQPCRAAAAPAPRMQAPGQEGDGGAR